MEKNKSIARTLSVSAAYIIVATILTFLRPIHQDDGWYASVAMKMFSRMHDSSLFSDWDFAVAGLQGEQSGFVFLVIQCLFMEIFGHGVLFSKVLAFTTAVTTMFLITRFVSHHDNRHILWLPTVFLGWPRFWYHFYNRPDMLGVAVAMLGLNLLARPGKHPDISTFTAFILPFIMVDIHPISVFMVFGYYCHEFLAHPEKRIPAIAGAITGLSINAAGNYLANGNPGILASFFGFAVLRGDHYIPILESDLADMIRIASARYSEYALIFLASLVWIPLYKYRSGLLSHIHSGYSPLLTSSIVFFLLSGLLSEAVSNGFYLYSSVFFFIFIFIAIRFSVISSTSTGWKKAFWALPFAGILIAANIYKIPSYAKYIHYSRYFLDQYNQIGPRLSDYRRGMLRPTFYFALAKNRGIYEHPFYILFYMKEHRIDFPEAVYRKEYDFIAIDSQDRRDMFTGSSRLRESWYRGKNPFYARISGIEIDSDEFEEMIDRNILTPLFEYDEISHGNTIFYRVNRPLLADFISVSGV